MFKIGDKVKVVKAVIAEKGWQNHWIMEMNLSIGKEYTVVRISEKYGIALDGSNYMFPPSSLEILEKVKPEKSLFSAGNKVKVVREPTPEDKGYDVWCENMAFLVGNIYTVIDNPVNGHCVLLDCTVWHYYVPIDVLEKVEE